MREAQRLARDGVGASLEAVLVHELVGEEHDVGVHPILLGEVHDRGRMRVRKPLEQAHVEALVARFAVADLESLSEKNWETAERKTYERRKLVVVAHEDERVGVSQRAETRRERDLRRLVDDADVELASCEDGSVKNLVSSSFREKSGAGKRTR